MQHHEEALARYVADARTRTEVLGVLLTGSVARGEERHDSDVDLVVVVTDEAWDAAVAADRVMYVQHDGAGYDQGYFDVKLATRSMLETAPRDADGPALSSLMTARCALDQGIDLPDALAAIRVRAGEPDLELAAAFVAQARLHGGWFLEEGMRQRDALLTAHAAVHLAVAAGRALLALAGVPHPGQKQLLAAVRSAPLCPPGFTAALEDVVVHPSATARDAVLDALEQLAGHLLETDLSLSRFVLDTEYAWFTGCTPPEYR